MEIPKSQINFIVGNIHVYTPDEKVCEEILKRIVKGTKGTPSWTPALIKKAQAYALKVHHEHQKLVKDFNL